MMLFVRQIIKTKNTRWQNGSTTLDMPVKHADAWISKAVKGLAVLHTRLKTLASHVGETNFTTARPTVRREAMT